MARRGDMKINKSDRKNKREYAGEQKRTHSAA